MAEKPSLESVLEKLISTRTKAEAGPEAQDARYKSDLEYLDKISSSNVRDMVVDFKKEIIEQNQIYDPSRDHEVIIPPTRFGDRDFTPTEEKEITKWSDKWGHAGTVYPTVEMILDMVNNKHRKFKYEPSEEAWKNAIVPIARQPAMR